MDTAIIGKGLIGGSLEKAAGRAGFRTGMFRGRGDVPDLSGFDVVFIALPPSAIVPKIREIAQKGNLKDGAIVVDIAGVKSPIYKELEGFPGDGRWHFVPGHPMAGKEKTGYENSCEDLFDRASMILVPYPYTPEEVLSRLEKYFAALGFGRTVIATPEQHDRMIAYTSQLCHLISSAYVRSPEACSHSGYSAGSFRDMVRVGAPDPDTWTELFSLNREALLPVIDGYIGRLAELREAIAGKDPSLLHAILENGVKAKKEIDK